MGRQYQLNFHLMHMFVQGFCINIVIGQVGKQLLQMVDSRARSWSDNPCKNSSSSL